MLDLREYQIDVLHHLQNSQAERECVQLATGAGKTFIFTTFAALKAKEGKSTLILINRVELMRQTVDVLMRHFGIMPVSVVAGCKATYVPSRKIYVAMVDTLARRPELLRDLRENIDTCIVDESHLGNFMKLINGWKRLIGFTATPLYDRKDDCLKNYYHNLHLGADIADLIEGGFLLEPETLAPEAKLRKKHIKNIKIRQGEYDSLQATNFLMEEKIFSPAIASIKERGRGRMIVYNQSVDHSRAVCEALRREGYVHVYHIDGTTPQPERVQTISNLKKYDDAIVCNCGVLTFGFDEPDVHTIVVNRLTKSLTLWLQMVGRGARLGVQTEKPNFILLDLYGNAFDHGLWQQTRNWQSIFAEIRERKGGDNDAPVKLCPECEQVLPAQVKICKYCNYVFPVAEVSADGVGQVSNLIVVEKEMIDGWLDEIQAKVEERGYNVYFGVHQIARRIAESGVNKSREELNDEMILALARWCEANHKRFDKWHKNYAIEALDKVLQNAN